MAKASDRLVHRGLSYGYDASGNLAAQNYPVGLSIAYAPNTLGRPMQASNDTIGVQYHLNGISH